MADIERTGDVSAITTSLPVPTTVGDALGARLEGLDREVRMMLDVAAVLGDVFDLTALIATSDLDRSTTLDAVEGAESVGLVRRVHDRDGVYCFVHSLARQTALDRMAPHSRAVAHARAAELLELSDDPTLIPSLANQYLAARILGYSEQAIAYPELAGRRAESILAYEDAARWFERAAALPECDAERRASLLFLLRGIIGGAAANGSGRFPYLRSMARLGQPRSRHASAEQACCDDRFASRLVTCQVHRTLDPHRPCSEASAVHVSTSIGGGRESPVRRVYPACGVGGASRARVEPGRQHPG